MTAMTHNTALAGLRMLIVEDESMVAMLLEDMLAELGVTHTAVAGSVRQALGLLAPGAASFDLALLDVNVRGEPVYPVADRLAALGIAFVFCSGYGAAGVAEPYRGVPVVGKPVELQALGETLAACRRGRPASY